MKKSNKYTYLKIIQQYYASNYGWEDVSQYDCDSTNWIANKAERDCYKSDLKEYNTLGYPTRVIHRKELNK